MADQRPEFGEVLLPAKGPSVSPFIVHSQQHVIATSADFLVQHGQPQTPQDRPQRHRFLASGNYLGVCTMPDKSCFQLGTISIVHGIPSGLRDPALSLFWKTFARKFQFTLGNEEQARSFLQRCSAPQQAICAIDAAGQLLGVATFSSDGNGFIHPTLHDFCAEYGNVGGFIRALIMSRLDYKPGKDEMMIESICVKASARGMGIGQTLLAYIKDLAQRQGKQNLVLDVIADNTGARRLYERLGFCDIGRKSFIFLAPVFGFRHAIRMQIRLIHA